MSESPRLYHELASWYYLLTAAEEYEEEAELYWRAILAASSAPPRTLLELGCGGGNMASHFKRWVDCTLTDVSDEMLALSQGLNPECEHILGDMRSLRLDRNFDVVFVHDAVNYLTTLDELAQAITTAFLHVRPGGVAVFAPDFIRETFAPTTTHGGHDGDGRALRFLEWDLDPDPSDTTYCAEFVYLLWEAGQPVRSVHEQHICGLFPRADWVGLMEQAGFRVTIAPRALPSEPEFDGEFFIGTRPPES